MNAARGTLFVEDAEVVSHETHAGNQHVLRLLSPQTAARAQPGNFIHIQCDPAILMRRPMSIMRVERRQGQIDILYKIHGLGTELLAKKRPGDVLNLVGPIGVPFKLSGYRPRPLLIGGGVGIPPMIFLSEHIKSQGARVKPLILMGSEVPFPFRPRSVAVPGSGNTGGGDRGDAAHGRLGVPEPFGEPEKPAWLLRGPCHRSRPLLARHSRCQPTRGHRGLRLRTDRDAALRDRAGPRVSASLSGIARRVHGLRRRRVCRL